jgi:hypothetical protein
MARRTHRPLQNHALSARNDSDRALIRLQKLITAFGPDHPEFLPLLEAMGQMQIMFQSSLGDFFVHAWGRRPPEFPDLHPPPPEPITDPDLMTPEDRKKYYMDRMEKQEIIREEWPE